MPAILAYAAPSAAEPLEKTTIQRRDLGLHDVLIEIKYVGICHSDIHMLRGDWGPKTYPLVPGHEIAGIVAATGDGVTKHTIGDRVGVGCLVNSCRECRDCLRGEEQFCVAGVGTYGSLDRDGTSTQGGYATHIVVTEDFIVKVPDNLNLDVAAPLLCAGITTYAPLRRWGAGPGRKIAVIGLGGLGHVAVKLSRAMGAEVTVISGSLRKRGDAIRLGADHYHAGNEPETFQRLAGTQDLIINTVSAGIDLDAYLRLLATDGTLVNLGAPAEPITLDVFSLLRGRRNLAGSIIGGISETQEMLDFCGNHGIGADVEVIPAHMINEAYERVLTSDVRYRFVIDTSTLS